MAFPVDQTKAAEFTTTAEPEPPLIPWDQLPQKTRLELEAGHRALGGAGLSAQQTYEASLHPKPPELAITQPLIATDEPRLFEPTEQTKREQEQGREVLARHRMMQEEAVQIAAKHAARLLEADAPAKNSDLDYTAPAQPE